MSEIIRPEDVGTPMRKPGFYWVRKDRRWQVAEWVILDPPIESMMHPNDPPILARWYLAHASIAYGNDDHLEDIGEKLLPPGALTSRPTIQ